MLELQKYSLEDRIEVQSRVSVILTISLGHKAQTSRMEERSHSASCDRRFQLAIHQQVDFDPSWVPRICAPPERTKLGQHHHGKNSSSPSSSGSSVKRSSDPRLGSRRVPKGSSDVSTCLIEYNSVHSIPDYSAPLWTKHLCHAFD